MSTPFRSLLDGRPAETAEELSAIAFSFMASKAVFAALHVDLFTVLADGPMTVPDLAGRIGIPASRVQILTTALCGIGVLERSAGGTVKNAPASDAFLSRRSKYDFGDYLRYQIDRQMYPFLLQLNAVLTDDLNDEAIASYKHWMADETQATVYSESQHAGSLGPGRTLARLVDLSAARTLLDVGGGTGAMTISLCRAYPDLHATIIDFPNVAEIGWRFVSEADLVDRVRYIPGNAIEARWPSRQDAILMSYLLSGVPGEAVPRLIARAFESLAPGGVLMVHDFMVTDAENSPPLAALWQLQHMAFTPDAQSLSVAWLTEAAQAHGFEVASEQPLIPAMTHLVELRKPL